MDDLLIGEHRGSAMLGQPGRDVFYGGGGNDIVNAVDRVRDLVIQCGERGDPSGTVLLDKNHPAPVACSKSRQGKPTPGLHAEHD